MLLPLQLLPMLLSHLEPTSPVLSQPDRVAIADTCVMNNRRAASIKHEKEALEREIERMRRALCPNELTPHPTKGVRAHPLGFRPPPEMRMDTATSNRTRTLTPPYFPAMSIGSFCPGFSDQLTTDAWASVVPKLGDGSGRWGDTEACPEGCFIHPASMAPPAPFNASEEVADGGLDITIFLQSAPRPMDTPNSGCAFFAKVSDTYGYKMCDAGSMLLATLHTLRTSMHLPRAPAVLSFDGLKCSMHSDMLPAAADAYVDKILHVQQQVAGTPTQLVVHSIWLHPAEATRRSMLLGLARTRLVFVGDDDFIFLRPVDFGGLYRLMTSRGVAPEVGYVVFPWVGFGTAASDGRASPCWNSDYCSRNCKEHPLSNGTLLSTLTFNNQPHIALSSLYMGTVWQTVPRNQRTAIEHHANAFAWSEANWNGWIYHSPDASGGKLAVSHIGQMARLSARNDARSSTSTFSHAKRNQASATLPICVFLMLTCLLTISYVSATGAFT